MYDIYIKNYVNSSGALATGEVKLYSVPIEVSSNNVLIDPVIKMEMGKTGSFEFSIMPTNPYYDRFLQMKTVMRVEYDGTTIFRGRVLMIDNTPLTGERKIHLEGDLAFLMDTVQPGVDEDDREKVTILKYLKELIRVHNEQIRDDGTYASTSTKPAESPSSGSSSSSSSTGRLIPTDASAVDKRIELGEVPGQYTSVTKSAQRIKITSDKDKFGSSSWETTSNALDSLADEYGGFFRTRYVGETCYLDWLNYCFNYEVNEQPIKVRENLIDISASTEVDNLFTALIPIGTDSDGEDLFIDGYMENIHGKNKRILVPQIVALYSDNELNDGYHRKEDYQNAIKDYGIIYKTKVFSNADSQEELWKYAVDWIKESYVGGLTSFTITALDMHHLDPSEIKYLVGDRVKVVYPDMATHTDGSTTNVSRNLTIVSAEYYLHNPEKNQFSVGVPNLLVNREYGSSSSSSSSSTSSGSGAGSNGGGGGGENQYEYLRRHNEKWEGVARRYVVNKRNNEDVYMSIYNDKVQYYGGGKDAEEKAAKVSSTILNSNILVIQKGLSAGDSDYSSENEGSHITTHHKNQVRSMLLDGASGSFSINGHVDTNKAYDLTDEQVETLNTNNRVFTFDAIKQEFGMKTAIDVTAGTASEIMNNTSTVMRMRIGLTGSTGSSSTSNKAQGILSIGTEDNPADSETTTPNYEVNGSGVVKQVTALFGKGDGSDPAKNPTGQINGKDGSAGFGNGGNLNGFKVTLNKPLTYTWTDSSGKTQSGTVSAGSVASDDIHFTKKYDSLRANLLVVDNLLADYAKINSLEALEIITDRFVSKEGNIDTLISKAITTDNINAKLSKADVTIGGVMTASSLAAGTITIQGHNFRQAPYYVSKSNDGEHLYFYTVDGRYIDFKKGDTEAAYNEGWNACIDAAKAKTCLSGYTTYNSNPTSLYLKNAAYPVTGEAQVWRYGGSVDTYYELPDRK